MSKKIEKLTQEQEAYLPIFRQEYLDQAIGGHRTDRARLEAALAAAYAEIGKAPPTVIILQSPLQALMAIKFMKTLASKDLGGQIRDQLWDQLGGQLGGQLGNQLGNQLRVQLWDQLGGQLGGQLGNQLGNQLRVQLGNQLRDQIGNQLRNQLWDQLWVQLRGQLGNQLRDQLGNQLWDQLWVQLGVQLGDQLRDQLRDQLGDQLWNQLGNQLRGQLGNQLWDPNYLWGSQDLYWIAWGKFAEHIGVRLTDEQSSRLEIMRQIGFECEWWWPFESFVFASERPKLTSWDEQGRLHNETGPAVRYLDGYSLHAWHGVAVPGHWIDDRENVDPAEIIRAENVEQRAAGAAILGWPRMLSVLKEKVIDQHENPQIGALIELTLPGLDEPGRFLKAECPRNGTICEGIPRVSDIDGLPIDTALAAQAWRIGDPQSEYQISPRRT